MARLFSRVWSRLHAGRRLERAAARWRRQRLGAAHHPCGLEPLESRHLLAVWAELLADVSAQFPTSARDLAAVGVDAFFVGGDAAHGQELWRTNGSSPATLVLDIRPGANSSLPSKPYLTNVDGTLFFVANDGLHGYELWTSDGSSGGTVMVADLTPGPGSTTLRRLTAVNDTLLFSADNGTSGGELWTSDGTSSGTVLVKDILPGPASGLPAYGRYWENAGGTLFFIANDDYLWKSDGTSGGTQQVANYNASQDPPLFMGSSGNELFYGFAGQLYKSDGTSSGTVQLTSFPLNGSYNLVWYPRQFSNVGGTIFFTVKTGTPGPVQLWSSDGTSAGTQLVHNGVTYGTYRNLNDLTGVNGELYFDSRNGSGGWGLFKSDGTSSGTTMFVDLGPGGNNPYFNHFTNLNGKLLFSHRRAADGWNLWVSDGTSAGTMVLNPSTGGGSPKSLVNAEGTLYYISGGTQVWRSDGTSAGTFPVSLDPPSNPRDFTEAGDLTFFSADDGVHGRELWVSDGTSTGTRLVKDIHSGLAESTPSSLVNVGGTLYFAASDGATGVELWRSDGTSSGTTLVKDIQPGALGSSPFHLTNVGGTLLMAANDGVTGSELWTSNGTSSGTVLVRNIRAGIAGSLAPSPAGSGTFVNAAGTLLFAANNGSLGYELWRSNGTSTGTALVSNIRTGAASSSPAALTGVGAITFFTADNGAAGRELWRTDGTSTGTTLVRDIHPTSSSNPANLTNVGGALLLAANDGSHGYELWRSDGTSSGTSLVVDLNPGAADGLSTQPGGIVGFAGGALLNGNDGAAGPELWSSDGTSSGTALVKDIQSGPGGSNPRSLLVAGSKAYFVANDGTSGDEVWSSNGTASGTALTKDVGAGGLGSMPAMLAAAGGVVYAAADDGQHGVEPWTFRAVLPVANAGGPYTVREGTSVALTAAGSFDPTGPTLASYSWDVNGDNVFGDATGISPNLSWSQLTALGITSTSVNVPVRVRVTDSLGDMADSPAGSLTVLGRYVAAVSIENQNVKQFDSSGVGSTFLTAADGLLSPMGAAYDDNGNLYVADFLLQQVVKFTPDGVRTVVAGPAQGVITPTDVAVDPFGNIFVANYLASSILAILPGGATLVIADAADGIDRPFSLAVNSLGYVYATGIEARKVWQVAGFHAVSVIADASDGLLSPLGIAVDDGFNVYVADFLLGSITKFTAPHTHSTFVPAGALSAPTGMNFDPVTGSLYVAEYLGSNKIVSIAGVVTVFADSAAGVSLPFDVAVGYFAAPLPPPTPAPLGGAGKSPHASTSAGQRRAAARDAVLAQNLNWLALRIFGDGAADDR